MPEENEARMGLTGRSALAALESFCRFVWDYYLQHPEFIGLVNTEYLQQARPLRRSPRLGELVSPVVGLLAPALVAVQQKGRPCPRVPAVSPPPPPFHSRSRPRPWPARPRSSS